MAKESITIDNFQTIGLSSMTGFENIRCLNVSDEPGIAKVAGKLTLNSSTTIPSLPVAGVKAFGEYYVVDASDDLYKETWESVQSNFASGKIADWKNYIMGGRTTVLNAIDSVGTNAPFGGAWPSSGHVMCVVGDDDKVYVISGDQISTVEEVIGETFDPDNSDTYTAVKNAQNITLGVDANCCTAWNGNIVIGGDDGIIYVWNGVDDNLTDKVQTPEDSINQIITINRRVYLQAGKFGNLYFYDGTRVQLLKRGPISVFNYGIGVGASFQPESIAEIDNKLLYGVSCGSGETTGVYSLELSTGAYTCETEVSGGNDEDTTIGVLLPRTEKTYYVGWDYNGSSAGLDRKQDTKYSEDEAYLISQYYFLPTGWDKKTFQNPEINFAKPLTADDSAKIYYRENLNDAWILHETIDTVGTLRENLKSLPAERAIQIKCVLNDDAELINIILK